MCRLSFGKMHASDFPFSRFEHIMPPGVRVISPYKKFENLPISIVTSGRVHLDV